MGIGGGAPGDFSSFDSGIWAFVMGRAGMLSLIGGDKQATLEYSLAQKVHCGVGAEMAARRYRPRRRATRRYCIGQSKYLESSEMPCV